MFLPVSLNNRGTLDDRPQATKWLDVSILWKQTGKLIKILIKVEIRILMLYIKTTFT